MLLKRKAEILSEIMAVPLIETSQALLRFSERETESVYLAACMIADSMRNGGKLLLCGNGGSAADCQHLATEFVCRLSAKRKRKGFPALALTTDTSFLTAFCNDYGFEDIFARQVQALGRPGDVVLGISTGGASENVTRAIRLGRETGLGTIALTRRGGALGRLADVSVEVDSEETAVIQNVHIAVEHVICGLVEEMMLDERPCLDGK